MTRKNASDSEGFVVNAEILRHAHSDENKILHRIQNDWAKKFTTKTENSLFQLKRKKNPPKISTHPRHFKLT